MFYRFDIGLNIRALEERFVVITGHKHFQIRSKRHHYYKSFKLPIITRKRTLEKNPRKRFLLKNTNSLGVLLKSVPHDVGDL